MKQPLLLLIGVLVATTRAQSTTDDILSVIISEAASIFSSVTSVLGDTSTELTDASTASELTDSTMSFESIEPIATSLITSDAETSTTRTRPSRTTGIATSASTSSVSVLTAASITSQPTPSSTSTNTGDISDSGTAAAATATSVAPNSSSNHDRTLAIVLGTVLGALALGLLILLFLILCRRRRRHSAMVRSASLSSASDEALTARKIPSSHVTPLTGAFATRRSRSGSLGRRNNYGPPSMTERSQYNVPSPYEFRDPTVPFVPGAGDTRRSSQTLTTPNGDPFAQAGPFQDGTGLNNHPYHNDHHTGRMVAAGVGGAALGGAAARHASRSSERHRERRLSRDRELHPAHWDEPLPRSPHRHSGESMKRRSDSVPRGTFLGPQDLVKRALQKGTTPNVPNATTEGGVATFAAAPSGIGLRSHERGRSLQSEPPVYSVNSNDVSTGQQAGRDNIDPLTHDAVAPAVGVAALGAPASDTERIHPRSRTYPPIPPALMIQSPNTRRSMPSRSPKRTRFSDTDMYHEPIPIASDAPNDGFTNDPVSPISTAGTTKRSSNEMSATLVDRDLVSSPRSRSISPDRPVRLASDPSTHGPMPSAPPIGVPGSTATPNMHSRQQSGLVDAIQNHFSRTSEPISVSTSPVQPPTYQAYSPYRASEYEASHPPVGTSPQNNTMVRQISRKPVAYSPYNTTKLPPILSPPTADPGPRSNLISGVRKSIGNGSERENWWRGQEEAAWTNTYGNEPPVGNRTVRGRVGTA